MWRLPSIMDNKLSAQQKIQEDEYNFPYHYLNLLSRFQDIEYVSYIKIVKGLLGQLKGKKLLDFGCGDGRFEFELRKEGCSVLGVDFSKKAISFAKAFNYGHPGLSFVSADIRSLTGKKFDAILVIETLEHIKPEELPEIIQALHRLLKKDGKLIITVPSKNLPLSPKHYQHFNEDSLKKTLNKQFNIKKVIWQYNLSYSLRFAIRVLSVFGRVIELLNGQGAITQGYAKLLWKIYRAKMEIASLHNGKRLIAVCSPTDSF